MIAQRAAGLTLNEDGSASFRRRIEDWTGADDGMSMSQVIAATYAALGRAPCSLLSATLDDALEVEERPNMPGTIDQWPNWCLALPAPLEHLEQGQLASSIAEYLNGC
jgi:4-alpha-glucanotransferase